MFEYPFMNDIMRIVKEEEPEILSQSYDMDCSMTLRIRRSMMPKLRARLEKVETAKGFLMKSKIKKNKNIWHLKQQKENGVNCILSSVC